MPASPTTLTPSLLAQFANKSLPRGIRNNNPGNIDYNPGNDWRGQYKPSDIPQASRDSRFAQFQAPEYGIRAMLITFRTYQTKYQKTTIAQMIGRWAPPVENDVASYVASVSSAVGVPSNVPLDLTNQDLAVKFLKAVIKHETGVAQPYSDAVVALGVKLAN